MRPNWEHFGSQKSDSRELFSTFRPAASRGAPGPHPAIPKAPQRSPKASTRAIFGALWLKKGGPNASKAVHGWHVEPIFGQDCERMSGGGHFWSNLDMFFIFQSISMVLFAFIPQSTPGLGFQAKKNRDLKVRISFRFSFSSFPFLFVFSPTLPFCQPYLTGGTSAWGERGEVNLHPGVRRLSSGR